MKASWTIYWSELLSSDTHISFARVSRLSRLMCWFEKIFGWPCWRPWPRDMPSEKIWAHLRFLLNRAWYYCTTSGSAAFYNLYGHIISHHQNVFASVEVCSKFVPYAKPVSSLCWAPWPYWAISSRQNLEKAGFIIGPLPSVMLGHIGLPAHEGEVPCWLTMMNAATKIPLFLPIMLPIIFVHILALRHLHTIDTDSMEISGNLGMKGFHGRRAESRSARHTRTVRNINTPILKAVTIQNLLYRLLVMFMERPNSRLAKTHVVCEEWLLLAATSGSEEFADRVKESS